MLTKKSLKFILVILYYTFIKAFLFKKTVNFKSENTKNKVVVILTFKKGEVCIKLLYLTF